MKIRQTKLEDKEEVMKLVKGLYRKNCPSMIKKWEKDYGEIFKSTIIAEIDGKIVSYITFGLKDNSLYIGDLYVLPKYRRKKIATKLINFVDKIKNNLNKKFLLVDVRKKDYKAKKFYKKIGFGTFWENKLKKDLVRLRK